MSYISDQNRNLLLFLLELILKIVALHMEIALILVGIF
jgi:hypothetical protein